MSIFSLEPEARIRGTVLDHAGKPVSNVSVSAVRQEDAAKDHLVPTGSARTDAKGQFVIKGLPAAAYLIIAQMVQLGMAPPEWGTLVSRELVWRYLIEQGATPIPLKARGEQSDAQIVVEREVRYRVVVWPSGRGCPPRGRCDVIIRIGIIAQCVSRWQLRNPGHSLDITTS